MTREQIKRNMLDQKTFLIVINTSFLIVIKITVFL